MPSTIRTLPLHLGTCMADLTREAEKIKLNKKSPKMICNSLGKLLEEGKKHRLNGDDEMAYVVFMRWIDCIRWLQKTPEYAKKDSLKPYVSGSQVKEILDVLQDMKQKLEERYQAKRLEDSTRRIVNTNEKMQIEPEQYNDDDLLDEVGDIELNLPDTPTDEPSSKEPEISITCMETFHEMKKLAHRIIIIDIREQKDFQDSHIQSDQCINIPPELIKPGKLATDIIKSLHPVGNTRRVINHRAREHCDLIVLLDWQTTKMSFKPANRLYVLRETLWSWDPGVGYNKIVILDGGYKEWLTYFPAITTNPSVTVPDSEGDNIAEMLEEVQYPDLVQSDEDQPMTYVKSKPIPERSLKPKMNERKDLINNQSDTLDNRKTVGSRSSHNTNSFSFLSTQLTSPSNTRTNVFDNGLIDTTKSTTVYKKIVENSNMNDFQSGHNGKVSAMSGKNVENHVPKPAIDRSSKPSTVRTYDAESEKIINLLVEQKEALKSWVKLEKEKFDLESQLFSREDNEDGDSEHKAEMLKKIQQLQMIMDKKSKQNLEIEEKLRQYKEDNFPVEPSYQEQKDRLQLDIGLTLHETRTEAIRRKIFTSQRKKKLEENSEMRLKIMSTPPRENNEDTQRVPLKQDGASTNSGLKRSYSSPNLVQLESRKESASRGFDNNLPQVDRTSKPLQQQNQNRNNIANSAYLNNQPLRRDREQRMSPIFGDVHPGITGLKNLGNSCYMNSIIQCLSNTTSLARYFIQGSYTDDLNTKNRKTEGLVVEEVAQVIKALWCGHYRSISPRDLKVVIGQYSKLQFENCEQQDSHEFLTFLLDWMHNDLKTKAKLEPDRLLSNAEKEWDKAMDGETSIISQLFFGQLRSTISCATCGNSSTTYENFNSLTLSLPDAMRCTLDDCIRKYVSGQRVSGWRCPSCKAAREATKKFDFVKLAPIIVVHLNRFGESNGWIQKTNTAVDFPLDSLDLKSYVAHDSGNTNTNNSYHQTYNLYAVSNHYGTMEGGHYTAYCNSASQNKWYKYDDHTVREVSSNDVKSQTNSAYLLFYTSVPISPYMVM